MTLQEVAERLQIMGIKYTQRGSAIESILNIKTNGNAEQYSLFVTKPKGKQCTALLNIPGHVSKDLTLEQALRQYIEAVMDHVPRSN